MEDRRNCDDDRRNNLNRNSAEFPFIDKNGDYVEVDRSSIPDRRLSNISVEEVDCEAYIIAIIKTEQD